MARARGRFWCYHAADDLMSPEYIETLLAQTRGCPNAAVVFSDIEAFGGKGGAHLQESVLGASPFIRLLTMLHQHLLPVAFRGLTRIEVVQAIGGVPRNDEEDFFVDTAWVAAAAVFGELVRVPQPLYRKRYHDANESQRWASWPRQRRLRAWAAHCIDMLDQAVRIDAGPAEMRLMWLAAVGRLTSTTVLRGILDATTLSPSERRLLLAEFLRRARSLRGHPIPDLLDQSWREIERWTHAAFWVPHGKNTAIVDYSPRTVVAGRPFNPQSDGRNFLWVRLASPTSADLRVSLGGRVLDSYAEGSLLMALAPAEVTSEAGDLELTVVGPDGGRRSPPVLFRVETEQ
jgi:hypothetical protein